MAAPEVPYEAQAAAERRLEFLRAREKEREAKRLKLEKAKEEVIAPLRRERGEA